MKKILVLLAVMVVVMSTTAAMAFRLYFTSVTAYTDNTAIEPANLPVLHDFWVDGQPLSVGATTSPINLIDNTYGATHTYKGRARLADGRVSDNVVATLSNPFDLRLPKVPGAGWSIGN
jgi:hypothetical protein